MGVGPIIYSGCGSIVNAKIECNDEVQIRYEELCVDPE